MFGSIKKHVDDTVTNDIETIIGKNTVLKGEINSTGNLRIDGTVEGGISTIGSVIIGENGIVKGDIKAASLNISGQVNGNVELEGLLSITANGQLIGDSKVASMNISDGGVFKGRSEMAIKTRQAVEAKD